MKGKDFFLLKEYILTLFEKETDRVNERFDGVEKQLDLMDRAVTKAETATEKRFEGVNEFRAQLSDQSRTFVPRLEVEEKLKNIKEIATKSGSRVSTMEDVKKGSSLMLVYVITILGLLTAITSLIMSIIK